MSIDKTDIKVGAAHEIGCRLDDVLDGATKDMYRLEGAASAFQQATKSIESLMKIVDKDLDGDKIDLETIKVIKSYVQRAHNVMINLSSQAETNKLTQSGKVQAMQKAIEITKKFKDEELNKAQNLRIAYVRMKEQLEAREKNSIDSAEDITDEKIPRPTGMRPGLSIKERRKLAAAATMQPEEEISDEIVEGEILEIVETTQENSENTKVQQEVPDSNEETVKPKVKRQKK